MFEIDKKKFGAFVAELRRERGYTPKDLAQRLFLSDKAVSKWETGTSLPDTTLLIPLAELLGVSVTELLLCQRVEAQADLDPDRVERAVKTAISYGEAPAAGLRGRGKWTAIYLLSVAVGVMGLVLNYLQGRVTEMTLTVTLLGMVFGAYYCIFAQTRLPEYYDQHRITGVYDGAFRMNVPGLAFNNSNWPYLVLVGRIWSCVSAGLWPLLSALLTALTAGEWLQVERWLLLPLFLGGLFVPLYVVGRRYQ